MKMLETILRGRTVSRDFRKKYIDDTIREQTRMYTVPPEEKSFGGLDKGMVGPGMGAKLDPYGEDRKRLANSPQNPDVVPSSPESFGTDKVPSSPESFDTPRPYDNQQLPPTDPMEAIQSIHSRPPTQAEIDKESHPDSIEGFGQYMSGQSGVQEAYEDEDGDTYGWRERFDFGGHDGQDANTAPHVQYDPVENNQETRPYPNNEERNHKFKRKRMLGGSQEEFDYTVNGNNYSGPDDREFDYNQPDKI